MSQTMEYIWDILASHTCTVYLYSNSGLSSQLVASSSQLSSIGLREGSQAQRAFLFIAREIYIDLAPAEPPVLHRKLRWSYV